jgi:hypothetical protein
VLVGEGCQLISRRSDADRCRPDGGRGAGSTIVIVRLALPLVAVIWMGSNLAPADTYSVTAGV